MGKRLEIGIIYSENPGWIAGSYYLQNIIASLCYLPEQKQPIVHLICNSHAIFQPVFTKTKYPFLRYTPDHFSRFNLILRSIGRKITTIPFSKYRKYDTGIRKAKIIYPITDIYRANMLNDKNKAVAWIPDFQEEYLPHLFDETEIITRRKNYNYYIENQIPIIFSSKDAHSDFIKFYPNSNKTRCFVLPFAVFHPDFSNLNIESIKKKYSIKKSYLFCANQFWAHKNHLLLFDAFLQAKRNGLELQLICSGKIHDYRDESYKDKIISFIENNDLQEDIRLLGFISREEQLCIMKNSYAIVQPSLFEGWSTVVEDAKRLNKFIFLSDLRVHREQQPINSCFFNPNDVSDLMHKLLTVTPTNIPYNYEESVRQSAESFINIVESL